MTAPAPEAVASTQGNVVDPAVPASTPVEPPPAQEVVDKTDWKAEARKHEANAKANKKAADELATIKAAQLTDAERAAAERKQLETDAETLRSENVRYRAAAAHGISEDNFDLLGTGTEEEILARAERVGEFEDAILERDAAVSELAALRASLNLPGPVTGLTPGAPNSAPDSSYPASWFPQLNRAPVTPTS